MHQHVYFAYLPVIDWVCLKMGLIFQHFADCCISSHLDCAFLGLCTVLKQLHANKFSQRADGISHPLTESERNESSTTSESVTLRPPPLGFWGRGVTALRHASISIHIYVCIYIICMFFFQTCNMHVSFRHWLFRWLLNDHSCLQLNIRFREFSGLI